MTILSINDVVTASPVGIPVEKSVVISVDRETEGTIPDSCPVCGGEVAYGSRHCPDTDSVRSYCRNPECYRVIITVL